MNRVEIRIRDVAAISVKFVDSGGGTDWMDFTFVCADGSMHEVTAFVDRPLVIEGAALVELMAQEPPSDSQGIDDSYCNAVDAAGTFRG